MVTYLETDSNIDEESLQVNRTPEFGFWMYFRASRLGSIGSIIQNYPRLIVFVTTSLLRWKVRHMV